MGVYLFVPELNLMPTPIGRRGSCDDEAGMLCATKLVAQSETLLLHCGRRWCLLRRWVGRWRLLCSWRLSNRQLSRGR